MSADVARVKTILLTDGDQRSTLAAVRSLGRGGYRVVVGESVAPSLASRSRYCHLGLVYPSPYVDESAFVGAIGRAIADHGVDLVIPMTDITSAILAERPAALPAGVQIATVDAATFWRASDKIALHELAVSLGVPSPTTHIVRAPAESVDAGDMTFPCVLKPARSRLKTPTGWIKTAVRSVGSAEQYAHLMATVPEFRSPFMIQRQVEGDGVGVFALCDRGETRMLFSHRRLREKPPWGGVSVLREAIAVDPAAADYSRRLLRALGWHGVAMVEFKRERTTGVPFLMEINGRFWGSLQLAIDAGLDFPVSLARLYFGEAVPEQHEYRVGIRSRWLLGDLDHLLMRVKATAPAPPGAPPIAGLFLDFCRFARRDTYYEVESAGDPGPALHEFRSYLRALFRPARV
jgi:predicted ATP-grasp superfamily ATP-dependent carboligase